MTSLVVLTSHRRQRDFAVARGRVQQYRYAAITMSKSVGDTFEHPGAAQIQAVDMSKLRVGTIRNYRGLQPGCGGIAGNSGQES